MSIDISVATWNSQKTLLQCLYAIRQHLPVNHLIVVDHNSTDGTSDIIDMFNAEKIIENKGLGYARQLQIETCKTPLFLIIDSDVVVTPKIKDWFWQAHWKLNYTPKIGAVVGSDPDEPESHPSDKFWRKILPYLSSKSFTLHCTLFRKKAVEGMQIPSDLQVAEDYYIMRHMQRLGYIFQSSPAPFCHIGQYASLKTNEWVGANFRRACKTPFETLKVMVWKGLFTPAKAVPYVLATKDTKRLAGSVKQSFSWMKGFLNSGKYGVKVRK